MTHSTPSLPQWLEEILPADRGVQTLYVLDDGQYIDFPTGERVHYDSLAEAEVATRSTEWDTSVVDDRSGKENTLSGFGVSFPSSPTTSTLILSYTDADRRAYLESDYKQSLIAIEAYRKTPENFAAAWTMIDSHPAFWTRSLADDLWYWETSGYCSKLRQSVSVDEEGAVAIGIEAGGHVPTRQNLDTGEDELDYRGHYGDWRLELARPTFEAAIVEMAARVVLCFNDDGSGREGSDLVFESVKPEWVEELEERIEGLKGEDYT